MKQSKVQKLVLKSFDDIYNSCVKISKQWGKNTISVSLIRDTCQIMKKNALSMDLEELKEFKVKYIEVLSNIVKYCEKASKKMNSKDVPKKYLKEVIEAVKKGFKEGFNK